MPSPAVRVTTRQAAVGQGGLMNCSIVTNDRAGFSDKLNIVFDCGSVNLDHLRSGIQFLEDEEQIDILFISHLDADHCNGIDLLLAKTRVENVVLPCLDAASLTAIVCASLAEDGVPGNFRNFLADPVAWFADRGVKRVLFVKRDGDGDDAAPPFNPDDDGPEDGWTVLGDDNRDRKRKLRIRVDGRGATRAFVTAKGKTVEQHILKSSTSIKIDAPAAGSSLRSFNWLLLPYVHPFPEDKLDAFRRQARTIISFSDDPAAAKKTYSARLLKILQDETKRKNLKECYKILSRDNNRPSLSLYSGPLRQMPWKAESWKMRRWRFVDPEKSPVLLPFDHWYEPQPGWISTGDADLNSKGTRSAWLRRFEFLLETVSVFLLPHHGSNRSVHSEILRNMQHALAIACAARGRTHHPHPELIERLEFHGIGLWQVSEDPRSYFVTQVDMHV